MMYPASKADRTRWILERRGPKNPLDPSRAYAILWEEEADLQGRPISTHTLFLTNRECPFRCLMCDLWQNTLDQSISVENAVEQIVKAVNSLPPARQIKLYNSGSFFDNNAIPPDADNEIAQIVSNYERVVVECHPAFVGDRCLAFAEMLSGKLEVALGLETSHEPTLERLNKGMTTDRFAKTVDFLKSNEIDVRAFILVKPPFTSESEGIERAISSLDFCKDLKVDVACVIPTRAGNGAMDALRESGDFVPPRLTSLEACLNYGIKLDNMRVYADTWDIEKFYDCNCSPLRADRIEQMNKTQSWEPAISCTSCKAEEN